MSFKKIFNRKELPDIKTKSAMILDVRDRPNIKSWLILSIQHVFAMFGATVLLPMLINGIAKEEVIGTDVALLSSGIGTCIYILVTWFRVPIYLGSSAAYVSTMGAMYPIYGTSMFWGLLGVGTVYLLVSLGIFLFGTKWINKILPPVVVGPMIIVIGLGLAGIAVNDIFKTNDALFNNKPIIDNAGNWNIDWIGVLVGLGTAFMAMIIALLFKGRMKLIPILGALLFGFVIALIFSTFHKDFNKYSNVDWKATKTWIGLPDLSHSPLGKWKGPSGAKSSWVPFFLLMPIAFATIAEHIGDHTVLGVITGRDYINGKPGLHKTIAGDGLATMLGGLVGGPANTSYGENTTTVGLSRVASVYVTGLAAIFAIVMSFLQIIPTILGLIPHAVLGGVELILFGFIASNGLKILVDKKVNMHEVRNIFIVSTMLIFGLGGVAIGWTMDNLAIKFSGTSMAMLIGIILALALPQDRGLDFGRANKLRSGLDNKHE